MKIADVRCFTVAGTTTAEGSEERQVGMLDVYPEYAAREITRRPPGSSAPIQASYVEVESDDGLVGLFGPIFPETAVLILGKLRPTVLGKDPLAYEYIWDLMYRQDRHSRKGNQMMAISALDNALWDLRGKAMNRPVYQLIGGHT